MKGTQLYPKESCVTPSRERSQVKPHRRKQLLKFRRIKCTICSTSPNNNKKKEAPNLQAWTCLVKVSCVLFLFHSQKAAAMKRKFLVAQNSLTVAEEKLPRFDTGPQEPQDVVKRLTNGKANCFTIRTRITKLKCVNSEVRTVSIHPQWGCLHWPYGTMSESP